MRVIDEEPGSGRHILPDALNNREADVGPGVAGAGTKAEDAAVVACTGACSAARLKSDEDAGVLELACAAEEVIVPGLLELPSLLLRPHVAR